MRRNIPSEQIRSDPETAFFMLDIPVMSELILGEIKTNILVGALAAQEAQLATLNTDTITDRWVYRFYERRLEHTRLQYRAAHFITNGERNVERVVTSQEFPLLVAANQLLYDYLVQRGSAEISGEDLARMSLITTHPLDIPAQQVSDVDNAEFQH